MYDTAQFPCLPARNEGRAAMTGSPGGPSSGPRVNGRRSQTRRATPRGWLASKSSCVPCSWFCCHDTWRFDIAEDAVNYEGESLWLTVWRVHPGECADVC